MSRPETAVRARDRGPGQRLPVQAAAADERFGEFQRARMLAAMVQVCSERGLASTSVARVVERAGLSRATFYASFADRNDCFRAAFEEAVARAARSVVPAYRAQRGWAAQIRAGLAALLEFLDRHPQLARVCVVEALSADAATLERRQQLLEGLAAAVDGGRGEGQADPRCITAEALVGGALAVIHERLAAGDRTPLTELLNPLMSWLVLPYLGGARARRELRRQLPGASASRRAGRAPGSPPDPVVEHGLRLTYRTARVLAAIAAEPSSTSRRVAQNAGIADQGQISKLLARLEGRGLIENVAPGRPKRGAKAWILTARGHTLYRSVRVRLRHPGQATVGLLAGADQPGGLPGGLTARGAGRRRAALER